MIECPNCGHTRSIVVSLDYKNQNRAGCTRRYRKCKECGAHFITEERITVSQPKKGRKKKTDGIIRCKDCKYWDNLPTCSAFPEYHECHAPGNHTATTGEDFCSRAERKDDNVHE